LAKNKQIGHADLRGDAGIALIHRIVNKMGFVWNPLHLEAGIDGIIEIRDALTAEVSNCILQVQSKAGASYFRAETTESFEFLCDERDLDYWMRGNAPVVLVVSRPELDEAYWIGIKDYFRDPALRKTRKVIFSKSRDRLDVNSREKLAALGIAADSGHYLSALPSADTLVSNLLPVSDFPKRLYRATTRLRDPAIVWSRIKQGSNRANPEWLLHEGNIYSFHDLTFPPWTQVCITSTAQNLATDEFASSDDPNDRYVFVRIAGRCLDQILYRQGIRYCKEDSQFYFVATPDRKERKVGGLSVFKPYVSKTNTDRIAYYRHRAAELRLVSFDRRWYVQITPTYRFTTDGIRPSKYSAERLRGIKQLERQNKTHLRQLKLWEEVLRQTHLTRQLFPSTQLSLFADEPDTQQEVDPYSLLQFEPLLAFEVDWNVPESAWLPQPTEDGDSNISPGQGALFES
jgi:hypothetical protein